MTIIKNASSSWTSESMGHFVKEMKEVIKVTIKDEREFFILGRLFEKV